MIKASSVEPIRQNQLMIPLLIFALLPLAGCEDRPDRETLGTGETEAVFNANLSGGADGDPEGSGTARVTMDRDAGEVCYEIEVSGIADPTMAHIHEGAEGESGGVVVDFNTPEHGMSGCVSGVESGRMDEIIENPGSYYVNVHNAEYRGGAIRGQLSR